MNLEAYQRISEECGQYNAKLIAISKTKPTSDIQLLYEQGHRMFGENKVQEMEAKQVDLPKDIQWHMVGHLQRNKVKYIAPWVSMIESVDSPRLLKEVNKQARKAERKIPILLQVHIADEESKYGFQKEELIPYLNNLQEEQREMLEFAGLMGMATFTDDHQQVAREFRSLRELFDELRNGIFSSEESFNECSMGMSGDYKIALEEGSTMVRIGSTIFGERAAK